ncbi:MAG: hypothetical protein AMXMBFR64_60080 [Myxococcales bacterium]
MRISLKISGAIALAGLVLFGSYGLWLVASERQELEAALRRELGLLGRTLQVAVENALRDRQLQDVTETLELLERVDPLVDVFLHGPAGELVAASSGALATAASGRALAAVQRGGAHSWELDTEPPRLALGLPLLDDRGGTLGALVVSTPLASLQADVASTRRAVATTVALFVVVAASVGLLVGTVLIGRPLARLVHAMRRVRGGDLGAELVARRRDEVGEVAREFNAMLDELVAARLQLSEAADARLRFDRALQQADKLIAIGQLSAGLAHEIGSPLQVLGGRARMLDGAAEDPARVRATSAILVAQVERIGRIVQQLLSYARRRPAVIGPVALEGPVREVLDLVQYDARRRGVYVRLDAEPGLVAQADADQVQQVVLNLVSNALAVTPSGGEVGVSLESAVVEGPGGARRAVRIAVEDTGPGIPDDMQERLFEPFFTTRAAEGGTGLGLSVVKSIVTEHGGAVRFRSSPVGARFEVDIPAQEET